MFDYINGYPVMCFYSPCITGDRSEIGEYVSDVIGEDRKFKTGDRVPFLTSYYDYGESFIIFSEHKDETVCHAIVEGEVVGTYPALQAKTVYKDEMRVIDGRGNVLGIYQSQQLDSYLKDNEDLCDKTKELIHDYLIAYRSKSEADRYKILAKINKTRRLFYEKWVVPQLEEVIVMGKILFCWMELKEFALDPDIKIKKERTKLLKCFSEFAKMFPDSISNYKDWAKSKPQYKRALNEILDQLLI